MKVLIDTNVVWDVLTNRETWVQQSSEILKLAARQQIDAAITANTLTDIYYLTRKHLQDPDAARQALLQLMELLDVVSVNKTDCIKAFDMAMNDYEDALLARCAHRVKADCIITRNTQDFASSPVQAMTPADFLKRFFPA